MEAEEIHKNALLGLVHKVNTNAVQKPGIGPKITGVPHVLLLGASADIVSHGYDEPMYAGIRYDDGYLCILDKEDGTMDIVRGVSIVQSPWDAWVPSCQVPTEYVGNRHWDTWVS